MKMVCPVKYGNVEIYSNMAERYVKRGEVFIVVFGDGFPHREWRTGAVVMTAAAILDKNH